MKCNKATFVWLIAAGLREADCIYLYMYVSIYAQNRIIFPLKKKGTRFVTHPAIREQWAGEEPSFRPLSSVWREQSEYPDRRWTS